MPAAIEKISQLHSVRIGVTQRILRQRSIGSWDLIAIVIGGYGFAYGEPGHKKALAGVAAGTGIAVLATNVVSWLWGV